MALLTAGACGSRLPDDVLSEIDASRGGGSRSGSAASAGVDEELTDPDATAAELAAATTTDGGTAADGGGTGTSAGSGSAATRTSGAAAVADGCKGGATDVGVTDKEIKVASMVTASGPLPGATEGAYRGTAAYFAKLNAAGGLCGRKITVLKGDDGLDPARARAEFSRLEPQVFAFVGSLAVADSGYVDLIQKTGVPYIGTVVDPSGRTFANVFPKGEPNVAHTGPFVYFRQKYPDVKKAAFLYTDVAGVRANTPSSREPMKKVGYEIVYDSGAQATSPDYTAEVINMRNQGAEVVYLYAFEVNMNIRLARNMRQQNYEPKVKIAQIGYNSKLVELLGEVANGWVSHITYLPVINEDEPRRSPAVAEFLKWNLEAFPKGQIDLFPIGGWGSSALFENAARPLGAGLTRDALVKALSGIHRHDGGGITAPNDPATGTSEGCFVIVQVDKQKWVRQHPATGYECALGERFKY